ncbi:MAG TPA: two-component regulator propeller domain-containing protein, partial [Chthoniobacter sp.]|nr:two-component regulator propeller domain-containing protein [Chthoniobacter sp.]
VVSAGAADLAPAFSDPVTRSWQTEHGLPQNSVGAIVQTRDGYLWVGTGAGLARFDGVRFRTFGLQDGLRSVRISALVEDQEGGLWIGTSGGGMSRWAHAHMTSFGPNEGFPAGLEVIALAAGPDGSVWIGTDKGLVRWSHGKFDMMGEAEGLPRSQIRALLQDSKGTLWVSAITEGLFSGTNGHFTRVEGTEQIPSGVYVLQEDRDGAIWAGANALWKWSGANWQRFDTTNGLPAVPMQCLVQGSDGSLWVGTRGRGLYRSTAEGFVPAASAGPLATQSVAAVLIDRENSVWVGTVSEGLLRLSARMLQYWSANANLVPTTVTSVVEDPAGGLLVGTASQGIRRFENQNFTPLVDPAVSGTPIIYCTAATQDGAIWAAGEQCLFRFHQGQPTKAYLDPPIRGEAIRALCAEGETLWVGTYASTLLKCTAAGVQVVESAGSLPGTITCIVREATDSLWIGTSAGLVFWKGGQKQTWTTQDGLLTANIRSLHRDPDGTLWIGTLGGGLTCMRNGKFVNITTRQGLVDDVISQILPDDFGYLWLGCNRGLMRLYLRELEALADGKISELHPVVFGRNEGMLKEQCFGGTSPTACKTVDGRLFFPTMSGLAEVDPSQLQNLAAVVGPPSIEEIDVDQKPRPLDAALVLPPGHHRIDLSFTAPVLRGGEWERFRYRLEGFDSDWIEAGRNRFASYDGLPPGHYVFHVAASDGKGQWIEAGKSVILDIQPFFWQTVWCRAGALLLLLGFCGALVWWQQHRKYLRQLTELEQQRQHQAELAHAGRVALLGEMSASIAHELKQPLAAILSNAQAGLRFLQDDATEVEEVRHILRDIAASDRRASEIIGRMRDLMKKGDARIEPRDLNADVDQVLLLLHSDLVARHVSMETQLSPDLPLVHGDHIQLQQVILNLVINGCDAMHASPPDERRLLIETAHDAAGLVRVSVVDRGTGIAPDLMKRIFEPFYSTKDRGLGMGLAICRAVIKAHGGNLWIENNSERGATFHFTLMAREVAAA